MIGAIYIKHLSKLWKQEMNEHSRLIGPPNFLTVEVTNIFKGRIHRSSTLTDYCLTSFLFVSLILQLSEYSLLYLNLMDYVKMLLDRKLTNSVMRTSHLRIWIWLIGHRYEFNQSILVCTLELYSFLTNWLFIQATIQLSGLAFPWHHVRLRLLPFFQCAILTLRYVRDCSSTDHHMAAAIEIAWQS